MGYLIYESFEPKNPKRVLEPGEQHVMPSTGGAEQDTKFSSGRNSGGEEVPQEIVKSIHNDDLEFRVAAENAAERKVALFSPESVSRWRSVRLEPASILTGDLLEPGSMPKTFQISPFPDTTFVVLETSYVIREHTGSISWMGEIRGSENGTVEIHARGNAKEPTFSIKIFDPPRFFSISPTETIDAYLAIEGNPHQPEATL